MTAELVTAGPVRAGERTTGRLLGIDIARTVALLGMFSVHLLPATGAGLLSDVHQLALGRASALFALLSGVGLALATGGATPRTGPLLRRARLGALVRGGLVLAIGLAVASFATPAATILTYYGLLFVVAIPFLGLGWRPLAGLAALAAVLTPWLSLVLRDAGLDDVERVNISFAHFPSIGTALLTTLLTGYYPVLTWLTYLLAGLAVGRLPLGGPRPGRPRVAAAIAGTGVVLAGTASLVSFWAVRAAGGVPGLDQRMVAERAAGRNIGFRADDLLRESFYGVTPVPDRIWLLVRAPHSASIADLVHTGGTALLVVGLALLVTPYLADRVAGFLAAPGSIPLTLYALHVLTLGLIPTDLSPANSALSLVLSIAAALGLAAAVGAPRVRGPLEELVAVAVRRVVRP